MGDANEYAIKDATLVLFQGTEESSATFLGAYTLTATKVGDITDTDVSALYTQQRLATRGYRHQTRSMHRDG